MFVDPSGHYEVEAAGYIIEMTDEEYNNNWMEISRNLMYVNYGEITAEEFFGYLDEDLHLLYRIKGIEKERIYDMSLSSDQYTVSMAEKYLLNFREEYQNEFVNYYVQQSGGMNEANIRMYQVLYDCPPTVNRIKDRVSDDYIYQTPNMYDGYNYSVFDALGWMILTGGNVNFITQVRVIGNDNGVGGTGDEVYDTSADIQSNIISKFVSAYTMLDKTGHEVDKPLFYVGSTEFNGASAVDIYDRVVALLEEETFLGGIYYGRETPVTKSDEISTTNSGETPQSDGDQIKGYKEGHEGKQVIWIPYFPGGKDKEDMKTNLGSTYQGAKDNGIDVVIFQPNSYYLFECNTDLASMRIESIVEFIDETTKNLNYAEQPQIGIQLEFDMGLVTGRMQEVEIKGDILDQKQTEFRGVTANDKKTLFNLYLSALETLKKQENPIIGIYSGGPNEQGFANIYANKNTHNVGNHIPYDQQYNAKTRQVEYYNGVSYSNFANSYNSGNLIYDISQYIYNGKKSANLNTFGLNVPKEDEVQ